MNVWITHPVGGSRSSVAGRPQTARGRREMLPTPSNAVHLVEDRRQDRHATSVAPPHPFLRSGLGAFARVGLALFLSAGFACALGLYAGLPADNPKMSRACACFFSWCLLLLSAGASE